MIIDTNTNTKESCFTNVYINNIDLSVGEDELWDLCEKISGPGSVRSVAVFRARNRNSLAYGFCNFVSHEAAVRALDQLNRKILHSKKLSASRAVPKDIRERYRQNLNEKSNVNVYVKNFERSVSEETIRKAFMAYGNITNVRIMRDTKGFSKGFGFVSFTTHEEAENAIKGMNGKTFGHRIITVTYYTPKYQVESQGASPTMTPAITSVVPSSFVSEEMEYEYPSSSSSSTSSSDDEVETEMEKSVDRNNNNNNNNSYSYSYSSGSDSDNDTNSPSPPIGPEFCPVYYVKQNEQQQHTIRPSKVYNSHRNKYEIYLTNMRYVSDEEEVRQCFYDIKGITVTKVNNTRGIFQGKWKLSFLSKSDMRKALEICKSLVVRGRQVHAETVDNYGCDCYDSSSSSSSSSVFAVATADSYPSFVSETYIYRS